MMPYPQVSLLSAWAPVLTSCSLSEALQQLNTEAQTYIHMPSFSAAWNISTVLYT